MVFLMLLSIVFVARDMEYTKLSIFVLWQQGEEKEQPKAKAGPLSRSQSFFRPLAHALLLSLSLLRASSFTWLGWRAGTRRLYHYSPWCYGFVPYRPAQASSACTTLLLMVRFVCCACVRCRSVAHRTATQRSCGTMLLSIGTRSVALRSIKWALLRASSFPTTRAALARLTSRPSIGTRLSLSLQRNHNNAS